MYLFRIFYSFLPLRNPIGFGASDLIILAVAVLTVVILITKAWLLPYLHWLADRTWPSMAALFVTAILLRVVLLLHSPTPVPTGADDFGYILLGDTLTHFRFSNSVHPLHQFFEAVFILQQPSYASIYPLAQGFILALGQITLGNPWVGVLLSSGVFCALCYWMLKAWLRPILALVGGILALMQFGPLSPWVNSYWGGYTSAIAGCLVFGGLPRLSRQPKLRYGLSIGLGLSLQLLSRPFESIFLLGAVVCYFLFVSRTEMISLAKYFFAALAVLSAAASLMLIQDKAVTGKWFTLPYVLSRYQYGVPTTFAFQPSPVPHQQLTPEQELDYKAQSSIHDSTPPYFNRLFQRFRYTRFFVLPPLYFALLAFLPTLRQARYLWAASTILLFALGTNFYPYFFPQYVAAITCLFLLLVIRGLEQLRPVAHSLLFTLCCSGFGFWFLVYASAESTLLPLNDYQSWNYINIGDPQGRKAIDDQLLQAGGQQLVFVRYSAAHRFEEWIHNSADINASKTVWANDLGSAENEKLLQYYPGRKAWLLEPDVHPHALTPYLQESSTFLPVH